MSTQQTAVVGGGLMGVGIATKFALAGHEVLLLETSPARRAAIPEVVAGILQELIEAQTITAAESAAALARIRRTDALADLAPAALVIEAIPEVLALKLELYRQLEAIVAPTALLVSNTSGFLPDALSADLAHPERFLITHFWNPPHAIPLVEIVPGARTAPACVEQAVALLRGIGSEPVVLRKAVPGFIGAVMRASLGRRYAIAGPLESADLGGLGTILQVAAHLLPELAKDEAVLEELRTRTARGETGAASGTGFYHWDEERRAAMRRKRIDHQLSHPRA
jgi:3-hydroxybutyryl-CoA dehydrogenase